MDGDESVEYSGKFCCLLPVFENHKGSAAVCGAPSVRVWCMFVCLGRDGVGLIVCVCREAHNVDGQSDWKNVYGRMDGKEGGGRKHWPDGDRDRATGQRATGQSARTNTINPTTVAWTASEGGFCSRTSSRKTNRREFCQLN